MSLPARIASLAAFGLAIVASGCDAPCTIDGWIAEYAGDVELEDCGDVKAPPSGVGYDDSWLAARQCILAADRARRSYVVRFERGNIEGASQYAYVGLGTSDAWVVTLFARSVGAIGRARSVDRLECARLQDRGIDARPIIEMVSAWHARTR